MTLTKLEPGGRIGDLVFEAIRSAIISGELPAGQRLRIRDLAAELGTSVMPVREAIRRLEEIGLAEAEPYRGAVVKGFTDKELLDLYSVRRMLETQATTLGIPELTAHDVERMETERASMTAAIDAEDAVEYLARDEAFLSIIYAASGNDVLLEVIGILWHRCRTYKILGARRELAAGTPAALVDFHDQLLGAARVRDAATAGRVTTESLDAATSRIELAIHEDSSPR